MHHASGLRAFFRPSNYIEKVETSEMAVRKNMSPKYTSKKTQNTTDVHSRPRVQSQMLHNITA
jgi:hypothetical protein